MSSEDLLAITRLCMDVCQFVENMCAILLRVQTIVSLLEHIL